MQTGGHRLGRAIHAGATVIAGLCLGVGVLVAQDVAIPVDVHVPLLVKILTFDRSLKVQGELQIGVVYQKRYRTSASVADGARRAFEKVTPDILGGFAVRTVPIDLDDGGDIGAALAQRRLNALYVAPLRAVDIETVTRATRAAQVVTLTGVPEYVDDGIAVGIDRKRDRPQIVVNVGASRAEGADFTAQLLKLARIADEEHRR